MKSGISRRCGNPNPTYYAIAKSEFGSGGNSSCYSINQPPRFGLASSCVFYDITQGDNDIDCRYYNNWHTRTTVMAALGHLWIAGHASTKHPEPSSPRARATPALQPARSAHQQSQRVPIARRHNTVGRWHAGDLYCNKIRRRRRSPPSRFPTAARATRAVPVAL